MHVSGVVNPMQSASVKHCVRQSYAGVTHLPHSGASVGTHGGCWPFESTKKLVGPLTVLLMQLLQRAVPMSVDRLPAEHAWPAEASPVSPQ